MGVFGETLGILPRGYSKNSSKRLTFKNNWWYYSLKVIKFFLFWSDFHPICREFLAMTPIINNKHDLLRPNKILEICRLMQYLNIKKEIKFKDVETIYFIHFVTGQSGWTMKLDLEVQSNYELLLVYSKPTRELLLVYCFRIHPSGFRVHQQHYSGQFKYYVMNSCVATYEAHTVFGEKLFLACDI